MQPNAQNQNKNDSYRKILNTILIVLGSGLVLLGAYVLFVEISSKFMPVGFGDIILFALPLIYGAAVASLGYVMMVLIYTVSQLKHKLAPSKLHIIALIVVVIIGLLPNYGPLRLLSDITIKPVVDSISKSIEASQFEGPTDEQITKANIQAFDAAQLLFDTCNVSIISYSWFDLYAPLVEKNTYISVTARRDETVARGEEPISVHIVLSDKVRLEQAVSDYDKGPYPACQEDIEWIRKDLY